MDMKKICFSSFDKFEFEYKLNLTPDEMKASQDLSSRGDIIIQKADKVNSIVVPNKTGYTKKMNEMLSSIGKFKKLNVKF